jgi:CHAD domain-containing protein
MSDQPPTSPAPAAPAVPPVTVGPYLAAKLHALDVRLGETAPRVLSSSQDGEAVHDLRVALRRTRSVLEIGRPIFGRFRTDEVRSALRDLQQATGALRDEEVLLELVSSLGLNRPDVESWIAIRRRRERRLRRLLARSIEAGDLVRARRLLDALLAFRVDPARDRRLSKFARRAVALAQRRVVRRRTTRIDDAAALHQLRIACKRLRYVVETFAGNLPADLAALAQPATRLQSRLGSIHDIDVAAGCVRRARGLTLDARRELLAALERAREERLAAYGRDAGLAKVTPPPRLHAVGVVSLRNTSTR